MRKSLLPLLIFISLFSYSQTPNLVKDIYPGIKSSFLESPTANGSYIYDRLNPINNGIIFNATSNGTVNQLWYSDGSTSGTYQLDPNLNCGLNVSNQNYLNGKYYFPGATPTYGFEMFMTDGTPTGTKVLKDIVPGSGSSNPNPWLLHNTPNKMFFTANDGIIGTELYVTDGTTSGTSLVKDIEPGAASSTISLGPFINTINDNFYFIATTSANGQELWFTDGTTAGTKMVMDIWPGTPSSVVTIGFKYMRGAGNDLYFIANNGINGEELWFTNGTTSYMVKDIRPGSIATPINFIAFENNTLFFMADDAISGLELWRSDGTTPGTYLLHDITPGPSGSSYLFKNFNNKVFYNPAGGNSQVIWETDGTTLGTASLSIPALASHSLSLAYTDFFKFNNSLYFSVTTFTNNVEYDSIFFFKINTGLSSLNNFYTRPHIGPYSGFCNPAHFDSINPTLFRYQHSRGFSSERETIISDGSTANTIVCGYLSIPASGPGLFCYERDLISANNYLISLGVPTYTSGPNGMISNSLINGTGQTISTTIIPSVLHINSDQLFYRKHINKIYFRGYSSGLGHELCESDGTPSGTSVVLDIFPGSGDALLQESPYSTSYTDNFQTASSGGKFFFLANNNITGTELWCIGGLAGIEEKEINVHFSLYPNPTNDIVNLSLNQQFVGGNIQLFDAIGKLIQTQPIKNTTEKINLNLNSGIYFIKAITKDGVSKTQKLIIE